MTEHPVSNGSDGTVAKFSALCNNGDDPFWRIRKPFWRASENIFQYMVHTKHIGSRIITTKNVHE